MSQACSCRHLLRAAAFARQLGRLSAGRHSIGFQCNPRRGGGAMARSGALPASHARRLARAEPPRRRGRPAAARAARSLRNVRPSPARGAAPGRVSRPRPSRLGAAGWVSEIAGGGPALAARAPRSPPRQRAHAALAPPPRAAAPAGRAWADASIAPVRLSPRPAAAAPQALCLRALLESAAPCWLPAPGSRARTATSARGSAAAPRGRAPPTLPLMPSAQ